LTMTRRNFENREALAKALAQRVSQSLSKAVTMMGDAVLFVSGGNTPALFFEFLSKTEISWDKVTITLVDERQVDETSPRSNARLVKQNLMCNNAAAARFVPLFENTAAAAKLIPDCVILGMGEDGHTASFFPGGDRLTEALDRNSTCSISTMQAPSAGEPRLTYSLPRLLEAKTICLHIEGQSKINVMEKALAGSDQNEMPVRAVLHSGHPIEIFWCP
jgi:6-phosphogluconolactonase